MREPVLNRTREGVTDVHQKLLAKLGKITFLPHTTHTDGCQIYLLMT